MRSSHSYTACGLLIFRGEPTLYENCFHQFQLIYYCKDFKRGRGEGECGISKRSLYKTLIYVTIAT